MTQIVVSNIKHTVQNKLNSLSLMITLVVVEDLQLRVYLFTLNKGSL